jgi:hypothetical protein
MRSTEVRMWADQLAHLLVARDRMTSNEFAAFLGDDTGPPDAARVVAREGKGLEQVKDAWEQALIKRRMPEKGVIYRWKKRTATSMHGDDCLDIAGGIRLRLVGFTVFAPKPVVKKADGTVTYGQWKRRWLRDGTPIRSIAAVYIGHYELMQAANPTFPVVHTAPLALPTPVSGSTPRTTVGGRPLSGCGVPALKPEDLTITKLLDRVSKSMDVTTTNGVRFTTARRLIDRVLYGDTNFTEIDIRGWQLTFKELAELKGDDKQPLAKATVDNYWQSLVWLMDQAVDEGSLAVNLTKSVVKKRTRGEGKASAEMIVLTMTEVRRLERYAMAIDIAADQALRSGLVPKVRYSNGRPNLYPKFFRVTQSVPLPRGLPVDVDFHVCDIGGAAFVVPVGQVCRYWSKAMLVFILGLTQTMPRTGELLAWSMDQIDSKTHEVLLNRHRVQSVKDSVFGGRHLEVLVAGTKTTTLGRRVAMTPEFLSAYEAWLPVRAGLNLELGWHLEDTEGGGAVIPGCSGKIMVHSFAMRLLHCIQAAAGVRLAPPSHFRHSTETTNADLGVDRQATAETEGHSEAVASKHYVGESEARRALVARVAQKWREQMDDGATEATLIEQGYVQDDAGTGDESQAA